MTCKSSALCLFDSQEVQTDITGNVVTEHYPKNAIVGKSPIEFEITGSSDTYVDLGDIKILLHLKITKTKGKFDATADKISFVNLPLASVFKDVFVEIGTQQVEGGYHTYPYNAYLSTLLQFHPSAKKTHLEAWGWNEDTPGEFDDAANNTGFKLRQEDCGKGQIWELMGPLFLDITRQSRYLLPQTNLKFKFLPAEADFVLHNLGTTNDFDYEIEKCTLHIRKLSVLDSVISGHNKGLQRFNAKYPMNHIQILNFTITKGVQTHREDALFKSQLPKLLVVGLLEHDAFNGNMKKSPFNFEHFGLNKIVLYRDNELIPGQMFEPDYDNEKYKRVYNQTMTALNYFNTDDSNGMTLEHFKSGYNLYAFDLTPDATNQGPHRHINRTGSLSLELKFSTNVAKPLTVLMFAVLDAKLEITQVRDVIMSYAR